MSLDNAITRLRKIHDNPNPFPDDVRLDVEVTIYELQEAKARAEAAEAELRENEGVIRVWRRRAVEADADAQRYQWLRNADGDVALSIFLSTEPDEMDAAIDAELAKEGK